MSLQDIEQKNFKYTNQLKASLTTRNVAARGKVVNRFVLGGGAP